MGSWNKKFTKREFIGARYLDIIDGNKSVSLRAFRKWWPDGSSCLDIMKYVYDPGRGKQLYQPLQHIQIPWDIAAPFLPLFDVAD